MSGRGEDVCQSSVGLVCSLFSTRMVGRHWSAGQPGARGEGQCNVWCLAPKYVNANPIPATSASRLFRHLQASRLLLRFAATVMSCQGKAPSPLKLRKRTLLERLLLG